MMDASRVNGKGLISVSKIHKPGQRDQAYEF